MTPTLPRPPAPSAAVTSARKARAGADNGTFDAIAHHLNTSWGPRSLRGWCEGIGLRLSAHGALTAHAEEAAKGGRTSLPGGGVQLRTSICPPLGVEICC